MRKPRGHSSLDGLLEVLVVLGLFFLVPVLSVLALVTLSVLKIWFAFSWWWLLVPAGVLVLWSASFWLMNRS